MTRSSRRGWWRGRGSALVAGAVTALSIAACSGAPSMPVYTVSQGAPSSAPTTPAPTTPATLLTIPRNSNRGVAWVAPTTGIWQFDYVSGAYSVYPQGQSPAGQPTWLASVAIFKGRPIWDGETLVVKDAWLVIGWGGQYFLGQTDAEAAAAGQSLIGRLEKGDRITLITVDKQSRYFDNSGSNVRIRISLVP